VNNYGLRRCFVTYDGIEQSMMSLNKFYTNFCGALGIANSNSTLPAILREIQGGPTLLVIDNAETFLDADTEDAGYIREAITEVGASPSVRIILTTRSGNLPNLPWSQRTVSGLDAEASRAVFGAVYKNDIEDRLDSIFASLDFHTLSVSLLSHVATQHQCQTTEEIEKLWKEQKTRLLRNGRTKLQNLALTIELSIKSPLFRGITSSVLAFLRAVAFLPVGIHRDDLLGVFPRISDIDNIANAVCLSSLTHRSGDRYTMLAPIRMYIMDEYNSHLLYEDPLICAIRVHHYGELSSRPKEWVTRESVNTERLLSFDLSSAAIQRSHRLRLKTLGSADEFFLALRLYHLQTTSLLPLLDSASEERPLLTAGDFKIGAWESRRLVLAKAKCLESLCWLEYTQSQYSAALRTIEVAERFYRNHSPHCNKQLLQCLGLKGSVYQSRGDLAPADAALREGSSIARLLGDQLEEALLKRLLCGVVCLQGNLSEAKHLIGDSVRFLESIGDSWYLPGVLSDQAHLLVYEKDIDGARSLLKRAEELSYDDQERLSLLTKRASCEGWAGNITVTVKTLNEATATEVLPGMPQFNDYMDACRGKAYYEAMLGNLSIAQDLLTRVMALACSAAVESEIESTRFVSAIVAVFAGHIQEAMVILSSLLSDNKNGEDIAQQAIISASLGEIVLKNGDLDTAKAHFCRTKSICGTTGISPRHLYMSTCHWHTLPVEYNGWTRFLNGDI